MENRDISGFIFKPNATPHIEEQKLSKYKESGLFEHTSEKT